MRGIFIAIWLMASTSCGLAAESCVPVGALRVVAGGVAEDGSIRLADGRLVRLAGLTVPEPVQVASRQALAEMVTGGEVLLGNLAGTTDRHGRLPAQVFTADGRHLQGELLRRGLALVMTLPDERACARSLLSAESEGRQRGAGLWADPDFAIAAAENPGSLGDRNRYQIAEGRVISVGRTATTVYLDFGRNWATDFTVTVSVPDAASFESEGLALNDLIGRRVRVRGWLTESNGPMIAVDHPEQIEVLDR